MQCSKKCVSFDKLNQGEWFAYDGRLFVKTDEIKDEHEDSYNAVCLSPGKFAGDHIHFDPDDHITHHFLMDFPMELPKDC